MVQAIFEFFGSIGRARAANHMANLGYYDLAKKIMLSNEQPFEVHP